MTMLLCRDNAVYRSNSFKFERRAPEPDPKMVTLLGSPPNSATLTRTRMSLLLGHLQPAQRLQLVLEAEVAGQVWTPREGKEAQGS